MFINTILSNDRSVIWFIHPLLKKKRSLDQAREGGARPGIREQGQKKDMLCGEIGVLLTCQE
jgi:hypothetical protein